VKSPDEIDAIRRAVRLNSQALAVALKTVKPGRTRENELASEIDYQMRQLGAERPSFDTIVAAGARTALPHAHPTSEVIPCSELLLIDMGATVAGYSSDMTRTYATGDIRGKQRQMFKAVLQSQLAAIDAIRPGILTAAVDRAARSVLREYGWEKLFVHSTGHGLGLEIHERPRVGRKDRTKLEAGMVITVEPGVYLEGFGGIRIEDTVLVTKTGAEVLTPTDKHWQVL
jgi:Xaa-Pro aminopeptidase